ncbi:MAG: HTTM domain-containing protein [Kofleriaceae bacterium]|nr:HTTM domain-containing protein [Kofleriaceae bacterium]
MKRFADWWFAPAPAERLAAVRMLVGTFALLWVAGRLAESYAVAKLPAGHWKPIGITRLLDAPLPPTVTLVLGIVTVLLLLAFVLGAWFRWLAPLAALGLLWVITYRNSWGMVFHTENVLVLHVIALALAPSADAWSIDRAAGRGRAAIDATRGAVAPASTGYGWVLKLLVAITVVTYVLAGIAKLRIAGTAWLDGEQLRNHIAVDNLRKALLGDSFAPLATPFLDHPSGFTVFSVLTIVLELGAPVALLGGRVARLWALSAWGFHVGVVLLMNIWFPYPLLGIAYVALLHAERPFAWVIARWKRRRSSRE